ncbi:hypothetical protein PUR71_08345 [Streptomyces sp. SP17BM10]|nr:hypothetical protein [Streptomyces sp. SP17BM10]MEE1782924.1 hypothetical protein [Streptomyces sp. SP17BM10]
MMGAPHPAPKERRAQAVRAGETEMLDHGFAAVGTSTRHHAGDFS